MARYVTTADFDAVCDANVREALFDDTTAADGSGYSSTLFERAADLSSALAQAAAKNAGYDTGSSAVESSAVDMAKALALSALVRLAYGRKQRNVPEATTEVLGALLSAVQVGDLPIPDLAPNAADAVGGVVGTVRSSTSSAGYPPVFKDLHKLR